jgi:uncharacterized protein (TIGR04551 family)
MSRRVVALAACLWALPALALAQGTETPSEPGSPPDAEAPPPAPDRAPEPPEPPVPPPEVDLPEPGGESEAQVFEPPAGDISLDEWQRDDWLLLKPKHSLVELDGYFRLRGDLFRKLDFANQAGYERPIGSTAAASDLEPRYTALVGQSNYDSTNMRLRLEPRINVTDKIQIVTTVDVLDNLVLGSTPNTSPPQGGGTPSSILATSQNPPSEGSNWLTDSFVVKRAYARLTALNEQLELRFGRMPNHWGLGMMANDGDCLDCDYGDVVDRIALTFKAANHLWVPMFDWVSNGPVTTPFGRSGGQPIDAINRDDAVQYSLRIMRLDHPDDIEDRVSQGDMVINYGLWNMIRTQSEELVPEYYYGDLGNEEYDPAKPIESSDQREQGRDAFIYTGNGYAKLYSGPFELGAEVAFIWGTFHERFGNSDLNQLGKTTVYQLGGALEATWRLTGAQSGVILDLKTGAASGDSAPGFGALDRADTQRGERGATTDRDLQNFAFSPDYHVDLLMYRRVIGTVTDSWYVRPGLTYMFDESFAGKASAIYSQALFKRTVPGDSRKMGLEFDGELSYGIEGPDPGPFGASLMGGILIPFGAFKADPGDTESGGSFAWTVQARLYLTF